jgi:uncharacterized protein (DUF58 family)
VTPTPRSAAILALLALAAFVVPLELAGLAALALLAAAAVDARAVRRAPVVRRAVPQVLARGVPVPLTVSAEAAPSVRVRVRQAVPPGMALEPAEADGAIDGRLVPRLRGRHELPAVGTRSTGPLGLAAWHHEPGRADGTVAVSVYPDLLAARRLALSVRQGRFRGQGISARGPLGLGTEFELVRDYLPDDDVRQVNWRATARMGRPMSNQYRTEQDRDVIAVVDAGRLSAAPLPAAGGVRATVLDACLDALTAVALVADEAGDRFGAIAFDDEVRFAARPGRARGAAVVRSLFDLQAKPVESDYEAAFRRVEGSKRAFVLVLCDLLEESAARPLVEAVPVLARRHAVVVASPADPALEALTATPPRSEGELARAAVALEVRAARSRAAALVRGAGAQVLEAPAERLPSACVAAYLRAKQRARL